MTKSLYISFILIFLSACAAHHGAAVINSNPPGAQVISTETGELLGVTPLLLRWKENTGMRQQVSVRLNKEGYYSKTDAFWLDMNFRNAKDAQKGAAEVVIPMRRIGE